jgi:hypothetical protein
MEEASSKTETGGMDRWDVHEKYCPLQSSSVLYACTPANSDMMSSCISSSIFQTKVLAGRVQAWPKPLNGAGLNQNLHQVAVDETVQAHKW